MRVVSVIVPAVVSSLVLSFATMMSLFPVSFLRPFFLAVPSVSAFWSSPILFIVVTAPTPAPTPTVVTFLTQLVNIFTHLSNSAILTSPTRRLLNGLGRRLCVEVGGNLNPFSADIFEVSDESHFGYGLREINVDALVVNDHIVHCGVRLLTLLRSRVFDKRVAKWASRRLVSNYFTTRDGSKARKDELKVLFTRNWIQLADKENVVRWLDISIWNISKLWFKKKNKLKKRFRDKNIIRNKENMFDTIQVDMWYI